MSTEQVYTVPEVSRVLKVSPDTVRRLIDTKKLEATNISTGGERNHYRIWHKHLEEFLKAFTKK